MKNTELIKVNNLLDYKEELNKVKELDQDTYTAKQAAVYFGCATTQVKGYLSNYRQYFEGLIEISKDKGQQKILISKDAMFLLAILLDKKSKVSLQVTNTVRDLIANKPEVKAEEKKETKAKTKAKKELNDSKQLEMDLSKDIKIEQITIKDGKVTNKKEVKLTKEEIKEAINNKEKMQSLLDEFIADKNKEVETEQQEEKVSSKANQNIRNLFRQLEEIERLERIAQEENKLFAKMNSEVSLEKQIDESNEDLLELMTELKETNIILENYMHKCDILGLNKLESAMLLQESFVLDKCPDRAILNLLVEKAESEKIRKRGVLRESIELLASEKFNGEIKDTYHYLSNELRFYMGINMKKIREKQKFLTNSPMSYLDMIINEDGFEYAMEIIHTLLAE